MDTSVRRRPAGFVARRDVLLGAAALAAGCSRRAAAGQEPVSSGAAGPTSPSPSGAQVAGAQAQPPVVTLPVDPETASYRQAYPLSCEMAALHTALRLQGVDVSEQTMRPLLPENEDPDLGFRGDLDANQTLDDYGVHAKGLLNLLKALTAQGLVPAGTRGHVLHSLDEMRAAVAQRQPVVAWIPLQLREAQRVDNTLSTGKIVHLVEHEHTVTLYGCDASQVNVLDPFDGSTPTYAAGALAQGMALFDDPGLVIAVPG